MFILDLVRDGLTIQQSADLVRAYGVDQVTGADDDGLNLAHAVAQHLS
jgi:adenine/guanine phosphoribosyltransferase-like PRPP-binding protein